MKRAKISLKLKRPVGEESPAHIISPEKSDALEGVKAEEVDERGLGREIRQALAIVIEE